ncbi:hypothetical protein WNY78_16000 [Psychroserpens sp. AS72]|uniref:hypothetical protein n=1 Tax=Psychroserpens sp. AS72 TaxID=3135775 RepID=UPI00316FC9F6
MKLTAYLFFSLLLLTSCYSYNKIDLSVDSINSEKTYKVTTINGNKIKVKKCELTVDFLSCTKSKIPINEIVELKERKFSYLKTASIPIVYVGAGIGLLAIVMDN